MDKEQSQSSAARGLLILLSPNGEISHQVIGNLTTVEFLGVSKYLETLPTRRQMDLLGQSVIGSLNGILQVLQCLPGAQEERAECGQDSSSESSPSSVSSKPCTEPPGQ